MTAGEHINKNNTLGGMVSLGNGNNGVVLSSVGNIGIGLSGEGRKKLSKEERAARSAEREVRKTERQAKKAERLVAKLSLNPVDHPLNTESEGPVTKDKEPVQLATNDAALTIKSEKRKHSDEDLCGETKKKKLTKEERELRTAERLARKAARDAIKAEPHDQSSDGRTPPVAAKAESRKHQSPPSSDELSGEKKKLTKEERDLRTSQRQAREEARKATKEAEPHNQRVSSDAAITEAAQTKDEKRQQREKDRAERAQQKEERLKAREEKLQQRAEKKRIFDSVVLEQLPVGDIAHLFLDGNNMMFVANCLRSMTLNRNQRKVERFFDRFTIQYLEATEQKIGKATLVFDNTPAKRDQRVKGTDFELCSARPRFTTSDDAIVEWLSDIKATPGIKVFHTLSSDRGLIERIEKEGGVVMKPKKWMLHAATLIAKREVANLDTWMSEWCDSQTDV